MYEEMKATIEGVVDQGSINVDQLIDDRMVKAFSKWTPDFTSHQHPSVVEVFIFYIETKNKFFFFETKVYDIKLLKIGST